MPKEFTTREVEDLVLAILRDGRARNVFEIKAEAERRTKETVSGNTLNLVITRLEDDGKLSSEFKRIGGRQYSLSSRADT